MLGVRLTFHRDKDRPWLTDGTADWFWPEAERYGIPVMVHAPERIGDRAGDCCPAPRPYHHLRSHGVCARNHGRPGHGPRPGAVSPVGGAMPNVFVKVSALPCYSTEPYPFKTCASRCVA